MHKIILVDKNGLEHKLNFFISPVDSSGIVALQEAGIEYDLEIDQFQNDTVVIDGGAGYGEFSIECALKGAMKIYSFEPNPFLTDYLLRNTFDFPQIQVISKALWVNSNNSTLYFRPTGTASASIKEIQFDPDSEQGSDRNTIEISFFDIKSLVDKILNEYPDHSIVLKLDIEGAEYEIISYLSETKILAHFSTIYIEYHYGIQNLRNLLNQSFQEIKVEQKSNQMGLIRARK
jgi:FkbM family methyltransferase